MGFSRRSRVTLRDAMRSQARSLLRRIPTAHEVTLTQEEWARVLIPADVRELIERVGKVAHVQMTNSPEFAATFSGRNCGVRVSGARLPRLLGVYEFDAEAHAELAGKLEGLLDASDEAAVAMHAVDAAMALCATDAQLCRAWPQLFQLVEYKEEYREKIAEARRSASHARRVELTQAYRDLFKFGEHKLAMASLYPEHAVADADALAARVTPVEEARIKVAATNAALEPLY